VATGEYGVTLTFQGESSFGDKTDEYSAYIRVLPWGETSQETGIPQRTGYYVDIISPQWRGQQNRACAAIWQAFPPIESAPAWLDTPNDPSELSSSLPLHFLAALLIQRGEVDASDCPGGGLDYPTAANQCGVEKAAEELSAWQNQFDEEIMTTAKEIGIPAQLLKTSSPMKASSGQGSIMTLKKSAWVNSPVKAPIPPFCGIPSFISNSVRWCCLSQPAAKGTEHSLPASNPSCGERWCKK